MKRLRILHHNPQAYLGGTQQLAFDLAIQQRNMGLAVHMSGPGEQYTRYLEPAGVQQLSETRELQAEQILSIKPNIIQCYHIEELPHICEIVKQQTAQERAQIVLACTSYPNGL